MQVIKVLFGYELYYRHRWRVKTLAGMATQKIFACPLEVLKIKRNEQSKLKNFNRLGLCFRALLPDTPPLITDPCGLLVKMLVSNTGLFRFKFHRRQKIFFAILNFKLFYLLKLYHMIVGTRKMYSCMQYCITTILYIQVYFVELYCKFYRMFLIIFAL